MYRQTLELIEQEKIIVILRGIPREKLLPLVSAMYEGGIRLVELTYDACGNIPDEEIADRISFLAKHFAGKMMFGAGTVLKKSQIAQTKAAGGHFIISPDTNPDIITETKKEGLVSIPGALTPSEATLAHRCGADFVKLFPLTQLGVGYLKTICAPLSHISFLAVGGVRIGNILDYLHSGACGVGVGITSEQKEALEQNDYHYIEESFRELVNKIRV
ncbi:MAG: bifunctional 4-hydroxy-2-oxoglutarate aldolase/2-dehydro-3-deoxy-phosphogluconate aldolase [Clostridia bacterium]|nr:bifunctional 4-hydroxy-2-oxoglutarate aldolase/2-dehydro-3-deoxy-phosphogluconate aldolase [Clostridia bacterium]